VCVFVRVCVRVCVCICEHACVDGGKKARMHYLRMFLAVSSNSCSRATIVAAQKRCMYVYDVRVQMGTQPRLHIAHTHHLPTVTPAAAQNTNCNTPQHTHCYTLAATHYNTPADVDASGSAAAGLRKGCSISSKLLPPITTPDPSCTCPSNPSSTCINGCAPMAVCVYVRV